MLPNRRSIAVVLALLPTALLAVPAEAAAQYFGRNKVRYQSFDFQVLKSEHFDVYYYPPADEAAHMAARMAERWYARLSSLLRHELSGRQPIILYASHPHFRQTTALPGEIGEATGGATEALKRRIVLPLAGPLRESDHVLGHELVHAFQFDMSQRGGVFGGGLPSALGLPLWFAEGMAEYLSLGPEDAHTAMWMRDALRAERFPTIRDLSNPRYFPYRYGHALWAYVAGRFGDDVVGRILKEAAQTGAAEVALARVLGMSPDSLSNEWRSAVTEHFGSLAEGATGPDAYAHALLPGEVRGPSLHLAPALSPDGSQLVFLSERDRFAIEMFLADAHTGEVVRKIVKTALDPHFESLQFIHSAGAWHPDGRRFALAGVSGGKAVLSITDVRRGGVEQEFVVRQADEIFNPSWGPDGRRIVFTGQAGGVTDLFLLDVETGNVTRLTDDPYADVHPAWSPAGDQIAFVTDRFTTDLATLRFGDYQLALIDVAGGVPKPLPAFAGAKHINPQWTADGDALYFISDRGGVSNVYRVHIGSQTVRQVTNLRTGVSGISPLSPALSYGGGRLAFTTYLDGRYQIFVADSAAILEGEELLPQLADARGGLLPPVERNDARVPELLANDTLGLPPADVELPTEDYRGGLALNFVAPISVGVGSDQFGAFVGGGTTLFWSDLLGRHNLMTVLQVSGSFQDFTGLVGYQHLGGRWNRSVVAGQSTFLSLGFRRAVDTTAQSALDSLFLFRQINRQVQGAMAYPFNRVTRVEVSGGYRMSSFDRELRTREIETRPPLITVNDPVDLPAPTMVHVGEAGAALVYDNTLFGATAPILGRRFRLDAVSTFGGLQYITLLGDVRQYVMPVEPYTIAARIVHFGRYGRDSDDERLFPLFIGYETLVRGYGVRTFNLRDCPAIIQSTDDCPVPVFERLLGSRVLVGNVELRFPLFRGLGLGRQPAAFPPLEAAIFFDAGVAWEGGALPTVFGGDRQPVSSYGASLRTNLFGVAILEFGMVHPNDRPDVGWHFLFGVAPGF
jgi:Tol biopolymer transport system component